MILVDIIMYAFAAMIVSLAAVWVFAVAWILYNIVKMFLGKDD